MHLYIWIEIFYDERNVWSFVKAFLSAWKRKRFWCCSFVKKKRLSHICFSLQGRKKYESIRFRINISKTYSSPIYKAINLTLKKNNITSQRQFAVFEIQFPRFIVMFCLKLLLILMILKTVLISLLTISCDESNITNGLLI